MPGATSGPSIQYINWIAYPWGRFGRRYPLSEVSDGIRYLETMRARGKVVITA
jgi:hypothetical protein